MNALIGLRTYNGILYIYCNEVGGFDRMNNILVNFYRDDIKVRELLNLGFVDYLEKNLQPKGEHTFYEPEEGVTIFYSRDRGEYGDDDTEAIKLRVGREVDIKEMMVMYGKAFEADYYYLYSPEDKEWIMYSKDSFGGSIYNIRTGRPIGNRKDRLKITREESVKYARRIRLNKGKKFTIKTNKGRVYLVEESYVGDERFYKGLEDVSWEKFKKMSGGKNVTQKEIASYLYGKFNKT